ncbi:MAG TPA: zf-HC2 domain-containing protein [Thermoanaerobaculia bacterium]|nr:zf-HC2 domain-containing protein [Thermoanaerobaculia bacterium]
MSDDSREPPAIEHGTITDETAEHHPAAEELVAYHRRELAAAAAEELREHLADCTECADLVLDLAAHDMWPEHRDGLSEEELAAERERLARRLAQLREEG